MQINESIEDYLERIYMLRQETGRCRSVDIANALRVTKASVSHATKLLRENGYIVMAGATGIELTEAGEKIAERMYKRHTQLAEALVRLGVDPETAQLDACKMEHDISRQTFHAIIDCAGKSE